MALVSTGMVAGLHQHVGAEWGPQFWRKMADTSPNKVLTDTAERSVKRVKEDRKRKNTEAVKGENIS